MLNNHFPRSHFCLDEFAWFIFEDEEEDEELRCPVDGKTLVIYKKRAGYYACSCICGYHETAPTKEELKRKVGSKRFK